jgi:hypothetical protein
VRSRIKALNIEPINTKSVRLGGSVVHQPLPANTGQPGQNGSPGLSAYQVAQANGFTGTQSQWLASLVGTTGSQGPIGPTGPIGATGQTSVVVLAGDVMIDGGDAVGANLNSLTLDANGS